jgi:hypothetical protein
MTSHTSMLKCWSQPSQVVQNQFCSGAGHERPFSEVAPELAVQCQPPYACKTVESPGASRVCLVCLHAPHSTGTTAYVVHRRGLLLSAYSLAHRGQVRPPS